jgi:hypothetical protein
LFESIVARRFAPTHWLHHSQQFRASAFEPGRHIGSYRMQVLKENTMSNKLMIALATIGVVGCSFAGGALADPYHGTQEASSYDAATVSEDVGYAAVDTADESGYVSGPRYHGGPKNAW